MIQKTCKKCLSNFDPFPIIDGKKRNMYARSFCLNCSPFGGHNTRRIDIAKEQPPSFIDTLDSKTFNEIVKSSVSGADFFDKINMRISGSSYKIFARRLLREKTDTSHFERNNNAWIARNIPNEKIFCISQKSSLTTIKSRLRKQLLIPYRCTSCGISDEWNGKKITLELDHINGVRIDHRLENLRWMCPNCHSQTETYCRGRQRLEDSLVRSKARGVKKAASVEKKHAPRVWLRKVERPDRETLQEMVRSSPLTAIGKKYGVSDNSVRKWCKSYGLLLTPRKKVCK
jgi:predicted RNA-binding Zn-ribbon protein involved in translation (DUF1610 family)